MARLISFARAWHCDPWQTCPPGSSHNQDDDEWGWQWVAGWVGCARHGLFTMEMSPSICPHFHVNSMAQNRQLWGKDLRVPSGTETTPFIGTCCSFTPPPPGSNLFFPRVWPASTNSPIHCKTCLYLCPFRQWEKRFISSELLTRGCFPFPPVLLSCHVLCLIKHSLTFPFNPKVIIACWVSHANQEGTRELLHLTNNLKNGEGQATKGLGTQVGQQEEHKRKERMNYGCQESYKDNPVVAFCDYMTHSGIKSQASSVFSDSQWFGHCFFPNLIPKILLTGFRSKILNINWERATFTWTPKTDLLRFFPHCAAKKEIWLNNILPVKKSSIGDRFIFGFSSQVGN